MHKKEASQHINFGLSLSNILSSCTCTTIFLDCKNPRRSQGRGGGEWTDYEISSVPFLLDLLHKKRGERNLTYTMTQKRREILIAEGGVQTKIKHVTAQAWRNIESSEQRFNTGKEGHVLHYWQTPRDPIDTLYTVLDTRRPSIFRRLYIQTYIQTTWLNQ